MNFLVTFLLVPSLINELSKISDMFSLYLYKNYDFFEKLSSEHDMLLKSETKFFVYFKFRMISIQNNISTCNNGL